ncbi:HNH endonuclease [Geodermatophilus sp. DF01-2]|uniref:HNH endonuclease signature motif containing protein n=1 Tax=Geodermatophilus sp. DF01-2 TaxID=2559610 RepID=UPI001074399B|nr:HNH endonuclease signature motif containing protein [Geodermatophilus sp. DF01_2]TFV57124.1 HNH endonuclease [Geodermatophilus sp. DF01_2]
MFIGGGYGVGLTVTDVELPLVAPPGTAWPSLGELLPVHARSPEEKALELQRVQQLKAELAAYELELVAALAADRPASADRQPGQPGAAADAGNDAVPGVGAPEGVSEFFADELALTVNCARATATTLTEYALTLTGPLRATHAELTQGRLDWPRARAMAAELGWKIRDTDPDIVAAVEAAVLPDAAGLSVRKLKERLRAELAARNAAASDRRREQAHRAVNVRRRPVGDGISELVAGMPDELAAACQATIDELAWRAKQAGDERPIGMLRSGILADLVLRPWLVTEPVAAHVEVQVPIGALTPERFLASGAPVPPAFARPGSVVEPTGAVAGTPITAAHVRDLLAQLDAIGLQAPPGGSLTFSFTDDAGALQALATLRELRAAGRRGCRDHPGSDCGCPVITRPAPTDAYQPTAAQDRFITTRDRSCRHPGCDNRAGWADADHVIPHAAGGATDCSNLCCLCRRHHRLKTFAPGWTYTMTPDGILTVTTPAGVTRTSRPPGLQLTGPRVLTRPPEQPPPAPDPADDPPPF